MTGAWDEMGCKLVDDVVVIEVLALEGALNEAFDANIGDDLFVVDSSKLFWTEKKEINL